MFFFKPNKKKYGPGKENSSFWLIFALLSLGIALYGCENRSENRPQNSGPRESVSIALPLPPSNWLTVLAYEKGFFAQEGLDVTPRYDYPSGKRALMGLFRGEVDIAPSAKVPIMLASFERQDFRVFAAVGFYNNDEKMVARKDHGILKPQDLKGKRVASQKGSSSDFFQHLFLLKHGLKNKDVENHFLKVEELPHALARGEVDAISTREPFLGEALGFLKGEAVVFAEPKLYSKTFCMVASHQFIKKRPLVIRKILKALIQAEEFLSEEPELSKKILSDKLGIPAPQISMILKELDLRVSLTQSLLHGFSDQARWAMKNGLTAAKIVPNYLDFIYLDALEKVSLRRVGIIR